ncbi:EF-hand calcium-binding domain-containing protein 1 [Fasciola hepatica]|uniref:EF-hand calcium-binding domain-containing protein 1 n=1 Tax=Fasciola hepatica TaxID=6192 RepID=A0A4E0RHU9_FASHE|nr:EF-hand calcium-binding domain-containing protein 1 [Fasciola hepatica]
MLEVSIRKRIAHLVNLLEGQVNFTRSEIEHLLDMFVKINIKKPFSKLDRVTFREILHYVFQMTDDVMLDRIFRAFDVNAAGSISARHWILGMSIFLRGTIEQRAQCKFIVFLCNPCSAVSFRAYDLNSDGMITREEMFQLLKTSLIKQATDEDPDEGVRDLVDIVFKRLDMDHDGKVNFQDFMLAVHEDAMLLEILGPCFPEESVAIAFGSTFQEVQVPCEISYLKPEKSTGTATVT